MKIIGLTGGIGTGKSTVSAYLAMKGFPIIDADKIAREIVEPGEPALKKLCNAFGSEILLDDGSLNRKKLGEIVFDDKNKLQILDRIMLDEIIYIIRERIKGYAHEGKTEAVFIDAALLFETGVDAETDEVWVVRAGEAVRIARIVARDGISKRLAQEKIKNQMDNEQKAKRADHILDNSGSEEELYQQVDKLIGKNV